MNEDNMASGNYEDFVITTNDPLLNQTILNSPLPSLTINSANTLGSYGTINTNGFGSYITNNTSGFGFGTASPNITISNSLPGRVEIHGEGADILMNGKSLKNFMEKVEERLLILQPDPAKLEKYEALRKAYEHYKLLEKLVQED